MESPVNSTIESVSHIRCLYGLNVRRTSFTFSLKSLGMTPLTVYEVEPPKMVKFLRAMDKVLYTVFLPNPLSLIQALLRKTVKSSHIHMDPTIRAYEDLHW